mgnify:CR=1 FL=1
MKIIGSVKEDLTTEKRISITPETVKKFIELNFSILLEKKYGEHLGINDEEYKNTTCTRRSRFLNDEFVQNTRNYFRVLFL